MVKVVRMGSGGYGEVSRMGSGCNREWEVVLGMRLLVKVNGRRW